MGRSDISNRVRESIHKNYLFKDVHSIASGTFGELKDTFIFNQSWWLKDRVNEYSTSNAFVEVGLNFKFVDPSSSEGAGATSGHSHTIPEKRAELVLGLVNSLRTHLDVDWTEGCPPNNTTPPQEVSAYCLSPELGLQLHIWDPKDWTSNDNGFGHPDMNPLSTWSDDALKPNWMHNQPPSFERTPFRPVFNIDFRNDTKPAVPEGGFLKQAKLVLTVSQQSIAWPKNGITAEFWKLVDDCDETCDWYKKSNKQMTLNEYDAGGNTLGNWWNETLITGQTSGANTHYLPMPLHPYIAPMWTIGVGTDSQSIFWKTTDGDGPAGLPYDPVGRMSCSAGLWSRDSLMVWPAIDTIHTFTPPYNGIKCRTISIPTDYTATSQDQPSNTWINNWQIPGMNQVYDSWKFLKRAPETSGLTGCGGAIDISESGFVGGNGFDNAVSESAWYDHDGTYIDVPPLGENLSEWRPARKTNCREIHIPKFTNAGYTGGYNQLVNAFGNFGYATGPTGAADGRGITFSVDIGWWGRNAIAFSDQKLNLLFKGEFISRGSKNEESEYESSKALVELPEPNRHLVNAGDFATINDISPFSGPITWDTGIGPGRVNSMGQVINLDPVLPLTGTGAWPQTWSVNSGQIATNFYSVESPAPFNQASLLFKTKGSTLDMEFGNMEMDFILYNSVPTPIEPYDLITIKWTDTDTPPQFTSDDLKRRAKSIVSMLDETDVLQFTMGSQILDSNGDSHATDGYEYSIVAETVTISDIGQQGFVQFGVTGANSLYPTLQNTGLQQIIFSDVPERITGTHKISTDDEHWIVSSSPWTTIFPTNTINGESTPKEIYPYLTEEEANQPDIDYDNLKEIFAPHPNGGFYPDGPDATIFHNTNSGITSGGGSFINLTRQGVSDENNGSYTVLDVLYKDNINHITKEYVRVKEPVVESFAGFGGQGVQFNIKRVDHHPRVEITYRTKRQYDIP